MVGWFRKMLPPILGEEKEPAGREYLVFEYADGTEPGNEHEPFLYRHGSPHYDEAEALKDLEHKREYYSSVGRKFTLLVRGISPWREYEPFNPEAE